MYVNFLFYWWQLNAISLPRSLYYAILLWAIRTIVDSNICSDIGTASDIWTASVYMSGSNLRKIAIDVSYEFPYCLYLRSYHKRVSTIIRAVLKLTY